MIKSLLSKTFTILAFIFISSNSFAQQLDLNGDVIGMPGKTSPNNTMAYTPCPTLSGIDTTKNAYFCNTLTLGYSTMTAMGGPSPFSYSWFQTIGYTPIGLPAFTSTYSSSQARGFGLPVPLTLLLQVYAYQLILVLQINSFTL